MPHHPRHRRHHHGFRRGPGVVVYEAPSPVVWDEAVVLDRPESLDVLFVPPTDEPEAKVKQAGGTFYENSADAGDLLPTFVTPDDAKNYLNEVDGGYTRLDSAVQTSVAVPNDFKISWSIQMATWKAFYVSSTAGVGWLNTKAVMEQTDRFQSQLGDWTKLFVAAGGIAPGPIPMKPGQGVPGSGNPTSDIVKTVAAVGAVAALIIFGPALVRSFSH